MNEVQLYVKGERVDLFTDENISITSSIQNSTDIGKIFTDFSQSFTIPASSINNRIFKHYYNADIALGYNFDARQKVESIIEINYAHFRSGQLRLDGVQLKQGIPFAYKVTFFGSTVTLPDLMGEDLLSDLEGLNAYNHEYSESQVLTGLQTSLVSGNIVYPLISHTNRLFYDSDGSLSTGGNLFYDVAEATRGVKYTDLKPAIKLSAIIGAIELRYGLTFDSKFIDGTLTDFTDSFPDLFMWLHAKKGSMQTAEGAVTLSTVKNFSFDSGTNVISSISADGSVLFFNPVFVNDNKETYEIELTITPVEAGSYTIYVYKNNILIGTVPNVQGTQTTPAYDIDFPANISVQIETSGGITNYDASWFVEKFEIDPRTGDGGFVDSGTYVSNNQSLITTVNITDNIPNMKVIDFLTNLFKMFNLTAYVKQTGEVYVEPLDEFYSDGSSIDISQHIDNESGDINRAIPFRNIKFAYPESKTFFAQKRNQIFGGTQFGNLVSQQSKFDGTDYTVDVNFEKMLYEKMSDVASGNFTEIGWGWSVSYNGDSAEDVAKSSSVVGQPLIFYNVTTDSTATPISFWGSGHNSLTSYNRPSNVNILGTQTLNFNAEIDEFTLLVNNNSIYAKFYLTYMNQVFNTSARKYTYSAKLPNKLLLNYSINDTFVIGAREYIINSVQTNATTGQSKLELINKLF